MQTKIEKLQPPAALLATPPAPKIVPVQVTRDLLDNWKAEEAARRKAHAQIDEIRAWFDE